MTINSLVRRSYEMPTLMGACISRQRRQQLIHRDTFKVLSLRRAEPRSPFLDRSGERLLLQNCIPYLVPLRLGSSWSRCDASPHKILAT